MSDIWKYVKAKSFFQEFLPDITQPEKKISGKNTKGNPLDFSQIEKIRINTALKEMVKKLKVK